MVGCYSILCSTAVYTGTIIACIRKGPSKLDMFLNQCICKVQTCIPEETLTPPGHRVYSVTPRSVSLQNSFEVESVSLGHFDKGGGFVQTSPNSYGHKSL